VGSVLAISLEFLGCLGPTPGRTVGQCPSGSGFDQQDENWNEAIRGVGDSRVGQPRTRRFFECFWRVKSVKLGLSKAQLVSFFFVCVFGAPAFRMSKESKRLSSPELCRTLQNPRHLISFWPLTRMEVVALMRKSSWKRYFPWTIAECTDEHLEWPLVPEGAVPVFFQPGQSQLLLSVVSKGQGWQHSCEGTMNWDK